MPSLTHSIWKNHIKRGKLSNFSNLDEISICKNLLPKHVVNDIKKQLKVLSPSKDTFIMERFLFHKNEHKIDLFSTEISWMIVTVLFIIQEPPCKICRYSCSKPYLFIYMNCVSTCYIFS